MNAKVSNVEAGAVAWRWWDGNEWAYGNRPPPGRSDAQPLTHPAPAAREAVHGVGAAKIKAVLQEARDRMEEDGVAPAYMHDREVRRAVAGPLIDWIEDELLAPIEASEALAASPPPQAGPPHEHGIAPPFDRTKPPRSRGCGPSSRRARRP